VSVPFFVQASQKASLSLNAEMSGSLPFLVKPDKLDGSMAGDVGFDPMGLSDIQSDLKYARWAELKHGRMCMLAISGMIWQEYLPHFPGEAYTSTDPLGAVAAVGFAPNLQIFMTIGIIELTTFAKHYGEGEPGDIGWDFQGLTLKSDAAKKTMMEKEITHCRLAMIAFTGAMTQTLIFGKPLLG
jgi:light-harvesting complex I chlorophyll a/b binding protein 1